MAHHFSRAAASYAAVYSRTVTRVSYFHQKRHEIVMRFLQSLRGGLILDVGCGPGKYAEACAERGYRYCGVDVSDGMIAEGRGRYGELQGVEFAVADIRHLPFAGGSIDGLLCLGVLEYVAPGDAACLIEMARVVRPGGLLIFSFLNASSPYWLWVDYVFPAAKFGIRNLRALLTGSAWLAFRDCSGEGLRTRKFRLGERLKLLRKVGLSVLGKAYFSLNILPRPLDTMFARQSFWLSSKLERLLQKPAFGWLGMGFVIVAQKSAPVAAKD